MHKGFELLFHHHYSHLLVGQVKIVLTKYCNVEVIFR